MSHIASARSGRSARREIVSGTPTSCPMLPAQVAAIYAVRAFGLKGTAMRQDSTVDRRSTMGTTAGWSYGMLTAVAPRLSDALLSRQHRSQPDSAAAAATATSRPPR